MKNETADLRWYFWQLCLAETQTMNKCTERRTVFAYFDYAEHWHCATYMLWMIEPEIRSDAQLILNLYELIDIQKLLNI